MSFGMALLGGLILYNLLVRPAYLGRQHLLSQLPGLRQQVAQMELEALEVQRLAALGPASTPLNEGLESTLSATLHEHGLGGFQLTVTGGKARLQLHNVPFSSCARWLDDSRAEFGVTVSDAQVTALKEGQVDLTATLLTNRFAVDHGPRPAPERRVRPPSVPRGVGG